MSEKKRGA